MNTQVSCFRPTNLKIVPNGTSCFIHVIDEKAEQSLAIHQATDDQLLNLSNEILIYLKDKQKEPICPTS